MSMKFDRPAADNIIDQQRVIGRPVDRIEGTLKVTGTAPYAYERHDVAPDAAYGWVIGSAIAIGRISSIDSRDAQAAPGVIAIVTAASAGPLGKSQTNTANLLGGPVIEHFDQAVALVVADTLEQARDAAALVKVDYEPADGRFDLAASHAHAPIAPEGLAGPAKVEVGDFEGAFARAEIKIDQVYTTPDQSHMMMEPHATTAAWEGEKLTLWTSIQVVGVAVRAIAATLGIPKANVRVISPYVGGGFGAKLWIRADAVLAALGARAAGRPVKVALARRQIANNTVHRPATIQRVRIGADEHGVIDAIGHESWSGDLPGGSAESAAAQTRFLYRGAHRLIAHRLAELDLPEGGSMRAPGEAVGLLALEVAMDELAEQVGIDPVELRIRNDIQYDPEQGPDRPYSSRKFIECLQIGAERFSWSRRNPKPGQVRDGRWLVGMGVASAFRKNFNVPSGARARVDGRGLVTIETDMTDIGTGSYTIIAQTAAEMMGVALDQVVVRLGDSDFPTSAGSGGQCGANSSTAGVYAACMKLRQAIAQKVGISAEDATFADGRISAGSRSVPLGEAAAAGEIVAEDVMEYGDLTKKFQQSTFAAHFAEVGVDMATGESRVRRMLAVCAAGRILNPKAARSQVIGAMTMGIGAALSEELAVDKRLGFFVNHDLAGYEVPVHADVPHQDVIFLDEADAVSSPMKAKGVGELGLCGVSAAIANAIYNATGVRVREYPITLDKLLAKLPVMA